MKECFINKNFPKSTQKRRALKKLGLCNVQPEKEMIELFKSLTLSQLKKAV